ncbi:hypothetical protein Ga0609869_000894 [Rhodovulum iodosum]|uniref:DUF6455 domain-containing protein n=1 Tax=Rhodovulum iodosum TaxID=68291 RepID=A0ABV3XQE4_9RHOB|nr:DUF6455 family protein [Rhodovulum robiginosum]RSK33020.1 hypothetical protein EJA01_11955 [Rhodovulum robiginosum]
MDDSGKLSTHFWLAQGMARTVGLKLPAELKAGRLDRSDLAHFVAECCCCDRTDHCISWLAVQARGAETPPVWCALKPRIEALKETA